MKINKLIGCTLCAAVLAAFIVACNGLDPYSIHAPANLQKKIDSIANAQPNTGDTTYLTVATTIVGADDNSSAWWTAFSDYFTIPSNKLLHLEFVNYTSGVSNWNNWDVDVTNAVARGGSGYAEYFVLRSDAYGWGNTDFNIKMISLKSNGSPDTVNWSTFKTTMQGAYVTMEIDHSSTGYAFVTATSVGTNGTKLIETYNQPVSATADIAAFLICDGSHYVMKKAYLLPSKVTSIPDENPVSIAVTGAPTFVELGNKNFWGKATATVTYADGSAAQVDSASLSFNVIPDMTTVGTKTVVVAYSKTKEGAATSKPVTTAYQLDVKAAVTSLAITTPPTISSYYYYNSDSLIFNTAGLVVTATYSDATTGVIPNSSLKFSRIFASAGAQSAKISYVGTTSTITTTCPLTLIEGVSQTGATDFSSPWATYSTAYNVASGASKTFTLYLYSDNLQNWHSPSTVIGTTGNMDVNPNATDAATAVVRMDNYGWGSGYGTATLASNWNWSTFASSLSGSKLVITVTNNGNNTANVSYNVTYATGETHYQTYTGITVNSADLNCALAMEESYVVFIQ